MELFEKIDKIVDYKEKSNLYEWNKFDIFEISEMIKKLTEEERNKVLSNLKKEKREELKKLEEGGLL